MLPLKLNLALSLFKVPTCIKLTEPAQYSYSKDASLSVTMYIYVMKEQITNDSNKSREYTSSVSENWQPHKFKLFITKMYYMYVQYYRSMYIPTYVHL